MRRSRASKEKAIYDEYYKDQWGMVPTPLSPDLKGQLTTVDDIITFATAGKATLTLRSAKSGGRFTYKITKPEEPKGNVVFFVKLMNGPDNEKSFTYLGHVYSETFNGQPWLRYTHGPKSKISKQATSAIVFDWFWQKVINNKKLSPDLEVWHEGRCCRCGRKLTVPDSVAKGIGPDCETHMGEHHHG